MNWELIVAQRKETLVYPPANMNTHAHVYEWTHTIPKIHKYTQTI